jgi:hypothetical protein
LKKRGTNYSPTHEGQGRDNQIQIRVLVGSDDFRVLLLAPTEGKKEPSWIQLLPSARIRFQKKKKGKRSHLSEYYFTSVSSYTSLRKQRLLEQPGEKYFDYFVFNIVDYGVNCGLLCSGVRRRALAQTLSNDRGLDINSPLSAENHPQDLQFRRHQQRDNPTSARGFNNNSASDRGCGSTTTTRLRQRRLRRADYASSKG